MKTSEFFGKFKSGYLWGNLLAMAVVVVLLIVGVKYALDVYTHHGESLTVPSVKHKKYKDAERILDDLGLVVVVSDTGYVKTLPPDVILEQSIEAGEKVKSGRIIYLTVNALKTPTITLPDIIDNSSLREAMAKLTAMGFKLAMPQFVPGEKDWVYGVLVGGKSVVTGAKISVEDSLVIQVGNGMRDASDSVNYIDPIYPEEEDAIDEFEIMDDVTPADKPEATATEKKTTTTTTTTE
ncbi:MAG: PASTA domain-containing protein [Prevotella sp.]|nr:PASTA domain-containing protein [Prevotella sp.]